ncbi:MAG: hypothetical protein AAGD32_01720 [Planctomycetota bacterium]
MRLLASALAAFMLLALCVSPSTASKAERKTVGEIGYKIYAAKVYRWRGTTFKRKVAFYTFLTDGRVFAGLPIGGPAGFDPDTVPTGTWREEADRLVVEIAGKRTDLFKANKQIGGVETGVLERRWSQTKPADVFRPAVQPTKQMLADTAWTRESFASTGVRAPGTMITDVYTSSKIAFGGDGQFVAGSFAGANFSDLNERGDARGQGTGTNQSTQRGTYDLPSPFTLALTADGQTTTHCVFVLPSWERDEKPALLVDQKLLDLVEK